MKKLVIFVFCALFSASAMSAEVKVMFADSMTSETSVIQPYNDWYLGIDQEETSMAEMYANGWKLIQAVKLSAVADHKQFWLIFEK